ncbi:MAG TPA: NAD(P)H-hydrate dehydratase, partial [Bacteroidota bacterium]|nr:NAD(P)H-hydrate dehydratase [Bacteroidota bacterium]
RPGDHFPRRADVIVDAIFGTGFTGDARGLTRDAILRMNDAEGYVAAVDIPSGVDASTGGAGLAAVRADLTVAMGLAKIGHYLGRGAELSGLVRVADIGIPPSLMRVKRGGVFRVGPGDAATVLPPRPRNAHKYSAGSVLVIGGSRAFSGAPMMTAQAALRAGAGSVVLAFPASLRTVIARRLTEVILAPLPETPAGTLGSGALPDALARVARADAVAIGPGLSRDQETVRFVREFLARAEVPAVVDADALFALKGMKPAAFGAEHGRILTPHTGEFSALTGVDAADADALRVARACEAARTLRSIIVLKGAPTVTASPGGTVYVNSTGNPGMATVGSGDVLTGVIAGMLAQGAPAEAAAWGGVFVHGRAGDIARDRYGMRGLIATDIGEAVAIALAGLSPVAPGSR